VRLTGDNFDVVTWQNAMAWEGDAGPDEPDALSKFNMLFRTATLPTITNRPCDREWERSKHQLSYSGMCGVRGKVRITTLSDPR